MQNCLHRVTAVLFRYEDLVRGWMTFTDIEPSRQGLLLKNRLVEDALEGHAECIPI